MGKRHCQQRRTYKNCSYYITRTTCVFFESEKYKKCLDTFTKDCSNSFGFSFYN